MWFYVVTTIKTSHMNADIVINIIYTGLHMNYEVIHHALLKID